MCGGKDKENSEFVHAQSLKCANEGGTRTLADKVLHVAINKFDSLLPDGHGYGKYFGEDIKRLARCLGDSFAPHLTPLVPLLIRTIEEAHGCLDSIPDQERFARDLILFITKEYGDALNAHSIHLETFVMRHISMSSKYRSDPEFAAEYMPELLSCVKTHGGDRVVSVWHEYWKMIKEEIREARVEDNKSYISNYISSVAKCVQEMGSQVVSGTEVKEIGEMLSEELDKCKLHEETVKESRYERNDEKEIIASCVEMVDTGSKVLGGPFLSLVRPLLPLLCPLIDKSWKWQKDFKDDLNNFLPKIRDKCFSREDSDSSSHTRRLSDANIRDNSTSSDEENPPPSSNSSDEMTIDFKSFTALFRNLGSNDDTKKREAHDMFMKLPIGLKVKFLWKIGRAADDGKERFDALDKLDQLMKEDSNEWTEKDENSFCDEIFGCVLTEKNVKIHTKLVDIAIQVVKRRFDYNADGRSSKGLTKYVDQCSKSDSIPAMLTALRIIRASPSAFESSSQSLPHLFTVTTTHADSSLRKKAFECFSAVIDTRSTSDETMTKLLPIFSILVKKFKRGGLVVKKLDLDCLLQLSKRPLAVSSPLLVDIISIASEMVLHKDEDLRRTAGNILCWVITRGWNDVMAVVGEKTLETSCKALLQALLQVESAGEQLSITDTISQIANARYYADSPWTELLLLVRQGDPEHERHQWIVFMIVRSAPRAFLGQNEDFAAHLTEFIKNGSRSDEEQEHIGRRIKFDCLLCFAALVKASEKEEDERTGAALESLLTPLIEIARKEVEDDAENLMVLNSLSDLADTKMMRAHLSTVLDLCRTALSSPLADGGGHRDWLRRGISSLRQQIAYNSTPLASLPTPPTASRPQRDRRPVNRLEVNPQFKDYEAKM